MKVLSFLVISLLAIASAAEHAENECQNRLEPAVQIRGRTVTINEENFRKRNNVYLDDESGQALDFEYYILNEEKPVLYVTDFLNETTANELQDFCLSNQRFTRSPIRGNGNDPSVAESDIRTR